MSKATPINQIQQDMQQQQPPLDNVEEVLNEMNQNEQGGYYNDQQQMAPQQQQMAPPQQQQMMMPPLQQHQQMMPPMMMPPMMKQSQSTVERLMAELKEALVVAIVFIVLNFEPVSNALSGVLVRVSANPMVLLLLKGIIAGLLFYGARRLVINN
jgi:hypothetical protein